MTTQQVLIEQLKPHVTKPFISQTLAKTDYAGLFMMYIISRSFRVKHVGMQTETYPTMEHDEQPRLQVGE